MMDSYRRSLWNRATETDGGGALENLAHASAEGAKANIARISQAKGQSIHSLFWGLTVIFFFQSRRFLRRSIFLF